MPNPPRGIGGRPALADSARRRGAADEHVPPPMTGKQPFERLVERHGATVLRVCRSIAGADDADDAWSETFIAAMRAYPDLPADANNEAWLVRIAHNKCVDQLRAKHRRAIPVDELPAESAATDTADPHDADDLYAALGRLAPKQRQTVAYHYLTGMTYAEIADIVGGTADAARRAAADGIKALRTTYPGMTLRGTSP